MNKEREGNPCRTFYRALRVPPPKGKDPGKVTIQLRPLTTHKKLLNNYQKTVKKSRKRFFLFPKNCQKCSIKTVKVVQILNENLNFHGNLVTFGAENKTKSRVFTLKNNTIAIINKHENNFDIIQKTNLQNCQKIIHQNRQNEQYFY